MANIRTTEELNNPALNYFIAFKIELNDTNAKNIEDTIKKALSNTSGSLQLRRFLELKDDIMEVMVNDSVYNAQANAYTKGAGGRKAEAESAKKFKLKEAVGLAQIICMSRTEVYKSELADACASINRPIKYFEEKDFFDELAYLAKQGVKIIDNTDNKMPFGDYEKSDALVDTMKVPDIYGFLSTADPNKPITRKSSDADIKAASDALFAKSQKLAKLADKQAIGNLCAFVKKFLLKGPEEKKYYNYYIDLKADVWSDLATKKKFGVKELTIGQWIEYVQKIVDILKVSPEDAKAILGLGCVFYQQTVIGEDGKNAQFQECPYDDCGKLFKFGLKVCPHCGRALEAACWNCSGKVPVTKADPGCPSCGATRQSQKMFENKCAEITTLLLKPVIDTSVLKNRLLEAKNIIPTYTKATNSAVYKKIAELEKSVQEKINEEETLGKKYRDEETKIRKLIVEKKYQTALSIAKSLKTKFSSYNIKNTETIIAELTTYIDKTESILKYARAAVAQGNAQGAVAYAIKALEACQDSTEAATILQKYPPSPVTNVRAVYNNGKVKIEWDDNSKQEYVTYTIIKKIGALPANSEDGAVVERGLAMKYYEDANVVSATPYYYAVYSERNGIKSRVSTTTTPVIVYLDVLGVKQDFLTGGIKAMWEAPQNVKSIEVWKNVGPVAPLKPGEGTKVACDEKGFEDKCQGQNAYLIVCNYQTSSGIVKSKGIRVVYKPFEKIEPLQEPKISATEDSNRYVFKCKPGYVGKAYLFYSPVKIPVQTNVTLKYLEFSTLCKGLTRIQTTLNADGDLTFTLPKNGIYQIYPIVATEQLFVVSPPQLINTMEAINGFSVDVSGGSVTINGKVHPKGKNVIACVSNKAHAKTITENVEKFVFSRQEFDVNGKINIKLKAETVSYITLFTEFVDDGVTSYSTPIFLDPVDHREEVLVLFTLDYEISPTKQFKVTITFQSDKPADVPALLLMKGNPEPLNKNAGELCEKIEPLTLTKGFFSKKYTGKQVIKLDPISDKRMKLALFVAATSSYVKIRKVKKL